MLLGGASKIRPIQAKLVYVIGVGDGIFPQKTEGGALITEYEKELLSKEGIEFSSRLERNMSAELYYFYTSVCSPSDELFITYPEYDVSGGIVGKSPIISRLMPLFP